jgi:hypothetical protein
MNWTKPKELGRDLLVKVRHARHSIDVVTDIAMKAFVPMRARTSLVAVRVKNPRDGIHAFGRVERHRTAK